MAQDVRNGEQQQRIERVDIVAPVQRAEAIGEGGQRPGLVGLKPDVEASARIKALRHLRHHPRGHQHGG